MERILEQRWAENEENSKNQQKLEKNWLEQCGLTAACCEDLSSVLSTNSILVELYLSRNNLGDLGVNLLSAGLRDPNCKLQRLELEQCGLTAGCCKDLSSVLSTNSSLMGLNLNKNNLGDSGLKCLSAGLRDPNCELQKLLVSDNDLSPAMKTTLRKLADSEPGLEISC
nr:PREDICTED: NACHT, LRR and PYD domains-containing protein 3-like [Latimeria chalumnae]|eukprot:XP_014353387.1 PREDICTED: NACHT, LRR and PYD domains-containing protein 3-like [Latimeria chalumnae]